MMIDDSRVVIGVYAAVCIAGNVVIWIAANGFVCNLCFGSSCLGAYSIGVNGEQFFG